MLKGAPIVKILLPMANVVDVAPLIEDSRTIQVAVAGFQRAEQKRVDQSLQRVEIGADGHRVQVGIGLRYRRVEGYGALLE